MAETENSPSTLRTRGSRCLRAFACGLALLAGCTDGNAPFDPGASGQFALAVLPQYSLHGGQFAETLPITRIRLVARDSITGVVLGDTVADGLNPSLSSWNVELTLRVPETGRPAVVIVSIELIHVNANGVESVQWSGITAPIRVAPGQVVPSQAPIQVYPGPLTNLGVQSISILDAPDALVEGDSILLASEAVVDGNVTPAVFWSTLDPDVATAGPDGRVRTLRDGTARIVAAAGPRADTVSIAVLQRPTRVVVTPDTARADALGAEVQFDAVVFDARGAVVAGTAVDWSVSGGAEQLGAGRVRALDNGVAHITASVAGTGIAATGVLVVSQSVVSLEVDHPRLDFDGLSQTVPVTATARDRNGNVIAGVPIGWSSTNPVVARVDGAGIVTSAGLGDAAIVVSAGDVVVQIPVVVQHVPGSVRVTPATLAFDALGKVLRVEAEVIATDGTPLGLPVTWTSSAPSIVTVDGGAVTAVSNGDAVITARYGSLSATMAVTVAQVTARITVDPADAVVSVTSTTPLTAAALDGNGHPVATQFTWSSADPAVATVDEHGTVRGIGPGSVAITASAGGIDAAAHVVVTAPNLVAQLLQVSPDPVAEDGQLDAVLTLANTGEAPADAASWRLRLTATPGGPALAEAVAPLPALGPGATVSLPMSLLLGGDVIWPAAVFVEAVIDADGALIETSTADNRIVSNVVGVFLHAAAVEIDGGDVVLPAAGSTATLAVAVRDRHGRPLDRAVVWSSTNSDIASVGSTGLVTANAPGEAFIIATSGMAADTIRVRVAAPNLTIELLSTLDGTWIAGTTSAIGLRARNTGDGAAAETTLRIRIHAADGGHHDVVVPVPSLAAGATHELTADIMLPAGTPWPATVELELAIDPTSAISESDESDNAIVSGPVAIRFPVAAIDVVPTDVTLTALGAVAGLSPTARDQHGRGLAGRVVAYAAADAGIATVSADGVVTAVAPGATSVAVQSEDVTVTVPVVVTQVAHAVVIVEPPASVLVSQPVGLQAEVRDAGGTLIAGVAVGWSVVSGPATIDGAGVLIATGHGAITVQAGAGGVTAQAVMNALAPNLQVELLGVGEQVVVGDSVALLLRVRNAGAAPAAANVLRLSLRSADGAAVLLGDSLLPVPPLAAGESLDVPARVPVPVDVEWPASLRLVAVIDADDEVVETDETDNVAESGAVGVHYQVDSVVVEPDEVTLTALGATASLAVDVLDVRGRELTDRVVTFAVADAGIATVSAAGVVTAVAPGTTSVTVQSEDATATVPVVVTQVATVLTIADAPATVVAGNAFGLVAAAHDANGNDIADVAVAWTSSDHAVLAVDGAVATALAPGIATVQVTLGALSAQAVVEVVPGAPAEIAVIDGDEQAGRVAQTLPQPLTVEVRDANGFAVSGVLLEWAINTEESGTIGTLSNEATTTDENGRAAVSWTLGHRAGQHTSVARLAGLDVSATFRANARAGAPHGMSKRAGGLDAAVSTTLTDLIEIEVTDEFGNVVPDLKIEWSVQGGPQSALPNGQVTDTTTTNGSGVTSLEWSGFSTTVNLHRLRASVLDTGEAISLDIEKQTKPGPLKKLNLRPKAITLTVLEGDTIFTVDPMDEFNNPIPGVAFAWSSNQPEILEAESAGPGKGRGTSKKNGTATVTVQGTADGVGVDEQATVTIEQEAVTGITVKAAGDILTEAATVSLLLNNTIELTASGTDANGKTIGQFRWSVVDGGGIGNITFDGPTNQPIVTIRGAAVGELELQVSDPRRSTVRIIRVNVIAPLIDG